jgi:uncharacterized protein (DUF779 family)
VWTTQAASEAIGHLHAEMGQLILRHPGGREGEVEARIVTMPTQAGRTDLCIGIAGGVPFYVGRDEDASLDYPDFELFVRTDPRPGTRGGPAQCQRLMSRAIGTRGRGR